MPIRIRIRIRIRNFKTGSADPDPKKIGPDPQHCWPVKVIITNLYSADSFRASVAKGQGWKGESLVQICTIGIIFWKSYAICLQILFIKMLYTRQIWLESINYLYASPPPSPLHGPELIWMNLTPAWSINVNFMFEWTILPEFIS